MDISRCLLGQDIKIGKNYYGLFLIIFKITVNLYINIYI
jgi:hypothetical protein